MKFTLAQISLKPVIFMSVSAVFLTAFFLSTPSLVAAQELVSPLPEQIQLSSRSQLNTQYRAQLESYRIEERAFRLAKQEYHQLQTLASLEKVITAWKAVSLARNQVLITYLMILDSEVMVSYGLDEKVREQEHQMLTTLLDKVKFLESQIGLVQDRKEQESAEELFAIQAPFIKRAAGKVIAEILYSRSRLAQLQLAEYVTLKSGMIGEFEKNALRQAEKKRGFAEVQGLLDSVREHLDKVQSSIDQVSPEGSEGLPNQVRQKLQSEYGQLNRVRTYIRELMTE